MRFLILALSLIILQNPVLAQSKLQFSYSQIFSGLSSQEIYRTSQSVLSQNGWKTGLSDNKHFRIKAHHEQSSVFGTLQTEISLKIAGDTLTWHIRPCMILPENGKADTLYQTRQPETDSVRYAKSKSWFQALHQTMIHSIESQLLVKQELIEADKPVIYLYPKEKTHYQVSVHLNGNMRFQYPKPLNQSWDLVAFPDGKLQFPDGKQARYLFWEGELKGISSQITNGFSVPVAEAGKKISQQLSQMGLNDLEVADFMSYWLPRMSKFPFICYRFANENIAELATIQINPIPEQIIRIFMVWEGTTDLKNIPAQILPEVKRKPDVLVEWGGSQLTNEL